MRRGRDDGSVTAVVRGKGINAALVGWVEGKGGSRCRWWRA